MSAEAPAAEVAQALDAEWPDATCELLAADPWQLLVAVILSARTSDERVNQVMAVLNEHHLGPGSFMDMDPRDLQLLLRRVPLHGQKARAIVEAARHIVHRHGGEVPRDFDALADLPGVGRKTAAVVVGNAFGIPAVAADVHVQRIVHRLGWTATEHPLAAEQAVCNKLPERSWVRHSHQFIRLGRAHCRPVKPWCSRCPCRDFCPKQGVEVSR